MKILITGINGFVGSNLVNDLKANHTLYGLDLKTEAKEGVATIYSWNDLREGNLPQVDAIIHLAGKAHDVKNTSGSEIYFQVNTELTKEIYNHFLKSDTSKFVFFSSVKAAADFVPGEILTEDIEPNPVGPYGESKIKAEEYILANPSTKDQRIYILRPCMIHGPGNKGNLNLLYNVIKKGIPWPLGAYDNRRTFTSIDNLKFVINGLLTEDVDSGIYHIGDDESLSTNELIETICLALQQKAKIWAVPKRIMNSVAKIGTAIHLPLNNDRLNKLTENYVVSNSKIKKALEVDKLPVTARDGLFLTIKSFNDNK